jgi:predicted nuclease with TOPRIM domain
MNVQPTVASDMARATTGLAGNLSECCQRLAAENARLSAVLAKLQAENKSLKASLAEMLSEEIEIDDDEMVALAESQPPFEALIAELESAKE